MLPSLLSSPNKSVKAAVRKLPRLEGRRVRVRFLPALTADARKLYSNRDHGQPVHAATYIRRRVVVLDQQLKESPRELARILTHELFHFAWVRLSNENRRSYEKLLRAEFRQRARGELGWSAECRKICLRPPVAAAQDREWREYLCESFCDTAAWLYSGVRRHDEFTLARRHRHRRAAWFQTTFRGKQIPI